MAKRQGGGGRRPSAPGFRELREGDLKSGEFRPVYVLDGEDQLRIDQVIEAIRKRALDPAAAAFNEHSVAADDVGWQGVLQQAEAYPMLAGRQLVIARHADQLGWTKDSPGVLALTAYMKNPVPSTLLIIVGDQFHGNAAWVKAAKAAGYYFHFAAPGGRDLDAWADRAARQQGLDLAPAARQVLCELVGGDLRALLAEIEKLALLQAERGTAPSAEEIPTLVMDQAELQIFAVTDALTAGDGGEALRAWRRLAAWGRDVYEMTPVVTAHLRRVVVVATAVADGVTDAGEIARVTVLNSWMVREKLLPQARRLDAGSCRELLDACLECERTQKSRPIPPQLALERLLLTAAAVGRS